MNRAIGLVNLVVFFASVLALAVVVNYFAQVPGYRSRIDATKTRAYSLSDQTRKLLGEIEGEWTIALLMIQSETDRAVRRQIDEVLTRFVQASPSVSVVRVDPTDPATLGDYERVLADLQSRYGESVEQYDTLLDASQEAYDEVMLFVQQQSGTIDQLVQLAQTQGEFDEAAHAPILQRAGAMAVIAQQGGEVLDEVKRARRVHGSRPIADYETARSILVQALTNAANELYETSEALEALTQQAAVDARLRQYASANRAEYEQRARTLALTVDPLRHLPELELSTIGGQLASGEAALILSPDRAAVIPSSQLFPRSNIRSNSEGVVTFDQRFRGETLIASAMRSLLVEHMPMVVFMHAEEGSWLRQRDRQIDLFGVKSMLQAARFEVREWNITATEGDGASSGRPRGERGQPVVWVPIPPPQRAGIEPSREELRLIREIQKLVADGEPVLLSAYPSLLPRYGQKDPWADLGQPLGLRLATDSVIYESFPSANREPVIMRSQSVQRYVLGHAIANAVHGQQTHLTLPTVVEATDPLPEGVRQEVIVAVEPSDNRWLESNWSVDPSTLPERQPEQQFDEAKPLVVAASRPHPIERGDQRMLVVGSGGWMLTYIADEVTGLGGERFALVNPGNHELMLASVAWLAGMDNLIAQSPASQQVSRLEDVTDSHGLRWLLVMIMPIGCLGLGLLVWGVRRR